MRGLAILFLTALAVLGLIWISQRRLIYFPTQAIPDAATVLPGKEEVTYPTEDGLTLGGWFVRREDPGPGPTVLFLPGNAGNRSYRAPLAAAMARGGISVLLVDYRGYGGNPGHPSEEGLARDARAALRYLRGRADVDPDRIIYFGESLGTGAAVRLASEDPPAALILRSPFASLTDVARLHYPFLPIRWLLKDRYAAADRIAGVSAPVLVLAGERDRIIPLEQSRKLFEAASEPKRLFVMAGTDHNDRDFLDGGPMLAEIASFLRWAGVVEPE